MKSWSKVLVLFLCSVFLFSLVGCSGKSLKVIDSGDFEDVMDDMDYYVTIEDDEDYLSKGQEEAGYAYDEDYEYYVIFAQYEDEEDAVEEFDDMYDDLKDAKEDEEFDGSYKKTTGKNYQKCVVNGEFDDSNSSFPEDSTYTVVFQIENTLIVVMAYDNGKSDVKEVDKIVKELGY